METEIKTKADLDIRLSYLVEKRRDLEQRIAKNSRETYEVLTNPAPIIKRTIRDLVIDRNFRGDLLQLALSGLAGYAGKKIASTPFVAKLLDSLKARFFDAAPSESKEKEKEEANEKTSSGTTTELVDDLLQILLKKRRKD